jgi:hypothetical protein
MINLRKSNVEKIVMSLRNLRNNDKPSYMMLYNIKRSTRNEKKFYNEGTCVEDSIFGQEKQEISSVLMLRMEAQPLKEALPEGGSITVLFCHVECTQS